MTWGQRRLTSNFVCNGVALLGVPLLRKPMQCWRPRLRLRRKSTVQNTSAGGRCFGGTGVGRGFDSCAASLLTPNIGGALGIGIEHLQMRLGAAGCVVEVVDEFDMLV